VLVRREQCSSARSHGAGLARLTGFPSLDARKICTNLPISHLFTATTSTIGGELKNEFDRSSRVHCFERAASSSRNPS
jgi:hypothetical protein